MSQAPSVPPGWGKDRGIPGAAPDPSAAGTLNVALYPYVPEPAWYTAAVESAWYQRHPDVKLNWVDYDCYAADPPSALDVFAFDAIFATYFKDAGYLQGLPLTDIDDFFSWALQGLTINSQWVWAIPYLGCMNILVFAVGDSPLAAPNLTVDGLQRILGNSPDIEPCPPPRQGLLVDLTGGTTDACLYLQVWMENTGQYPLDPPLPPCPSGLDRQTMANLQTAVRIAGRKQASYQDRDGYQRLNWFLQGFGRAYVGLTENLHFVPPDVLPHLAFRPLPFASAPVGNIPLFADAIGVNSQVDPSKTGLAIELATLIASQEVTLNAFIGPDPSNPPQYLTPVRNSVMTAMAARWPTYQMIQTTLRTMGGTGFRIGQPSRGWLNANKSCIASQILGPGVEVDEAIFASPGYKSTPAGLWRKP